MFRYSISFQAVLFMIALFVAYWISHSLVREPNSTVSFFPLAVIFVLGGIVGSTITIIIMRMMEEKEEEKK
jgi:prolipoprotein diacylglyceryltransferase